MPRMGHPSLGSYTRAQLVTGRITSLSHWGSGLTSMRRSDPIRPVCLLDLHCIVAHMILGGHLSRSLCKELQLLFSIIYLIVERAILPVTAVEHYFFPLDGVQ